MTRIRQAEPSEYEDILDYLGTAYNVPSDYFPLRFPSWWGEHADFSRIWIMEKAGRIESLVRVFPLDLVLGPVEVSVAGVGAVSTRPESRGQGFMQRLLLHVIQELKEEDFCLSVLWGDRHRYRMFGYELGGSCPRLSIRLRGLEKCGIQEVQPTLYDGQKGILDRIGEAYGGHSFRRKRAPHENPLVYGKPGLTTWCGEAHGHFGYLTVRDPDHAVMEFGGAAEIVLGLASRLLAEREIRDLAFTFPAVSEVPAIFWSAASGWSIEPAAMIRILHLGPAVERFRPLLTTDPAASDPDLPLLDETEEVTRLFGVGRPGAAPFFCWPLDHV